MVAGLGGGLGYRLALDSHFAVHLEARWLTYIGNTFTGALGGTYRLRFRSWEPTAGIQLAGYTGGDIQVISSAAPTIPPPLAWAVQGRLGLLRFVDEQFAVSALGFDIGFGADAGSRATAVTVTFLELAIRL